MSNNTRFLSSLRHQTTLVPVAALDLMDEFDPRRERMASLNFELTENAIAQIDARNIGWMIRDMGLSMAAIFDLLLVTDRSRPTPAAVAVDEDLWEEPEQDLSTDDENDWEEPYWCFLGQHTIRRRDAILLNNEDDPAVEDWACEDCLRRVEPDDGDW